MTIGLRHGIDNLATVGITIRSDGGWHLTAADLDAGSGRGHMRLVGSRATVLADPLRVSLCAGPAATLAAPDPVTVCHGSGSKDLPVTFDQTVAASDVPGSYGIHLVFTAIAGF